MGVLEADLALVRRKAVRFEKEAVAAVTRAAQQEAEIDSLRRGSDNVRSELKEKASTTSRLEVGGGGCKNHWTVRKAIKKAEGIISYILYNNQYLN